MIFFVLALIWAAALLPSILHARANRNPIHTVGKFRNHLRVLESTTPNMPRAWAQEALRMRRRRRQEQVLRTLLALCATTLVAGLILDFRSVLVLHVVCDVALVWYGYSLFAARRRRRVQRRVLEQHHTYAEAAQFEPEAKVASQSGM